MDAVLNALYTLLNVLFLVGAAGCLLVIPRTAFELFHTFFEPDTQEEIDGTPRVAQS
jgi:hypothetical protein